MGAALNCDVTVCFAESNEHNQINVGTHYLSIGFCSLSTIVWEFQKSKVRFKMFQLPSSKNAADVIVSDITCSGMHIDKESTKC